MKAIEMEGLVDFQVNGVYFLISLKRTALARF
jgi:hypothetical protein